MEKKYENILGTKRSYGTTDYYFAKMTVGELVDSIGFAIELPVWKDI